MTTKDPDQKYMEFVNDWVHSQGKKFCYQGHDGRESDKLIDGMAADDIWGWLVPSDMVVNSPDELDDDLYFGYTEWSEDNGKLKLRWVDV